LLLWFESNGSHRHLRVTLLTFVYWRKVAFGAFRGVSLGGFDWRRLKGAAFSRKVSRDSVGPFPDTDLALSVTPRHRSGRGALFSVVIADVTPSLRRRGNTHE
jgi:hypothetical protein